MGVTGQSTGAGALKGAALGASVGSVFPGFGTAIGAAVGAVGGGIIGYVSGRKKQKKLDAEKKARERPQYDIPDSIKNNVQMYDMLANSSRMPGQSAIEDRLSASSANAANQIQRNFSDSSQALAGIAATKQNEASQYTDVGIQAANLQLQAKDKLANSRQVLAEYQDQQFNYNKNEPYLMALAEKRRVEDQSRADMEAGMQSFTNSMGTFGGGMYSQWSKGAQGSSMPQTQMRGPARSQPGKSASYYNNYPQNYQ